MAQSLVRTLDDDVIEVCRTKVRLAGKSLEQVLRGLIEPNARIALIERYHRAVPRKVRPLCKPEIGEGLERCPISCSTRVSP